MRADDTKDEADGVGDAELTTAVNPGDVETVKFDGAAADE